MQISMNHLTGTEFVLMCLVRCKMWLYAISFFISPRNNKSPCLDNQENLAKLGEAEDDGCGKHVNRRHALSEETKTRVMCFIKSLKGRKSIL